MRAWRRVALTNEESRRTLAGEGLAYRADEVAAAAIRYPPGLAGALRKCANEQLSSTSFFAGTTYAQWRWVWFNMWSGRAQRSRATSTTSNFALARWKSGKGRRLGLMP